MERAQIVEARDEIRALARKSEEECEKAIKWGQPSAAVRCSAHARGLYTAARVLEDKLTKDAEGSDCEVT